VSLAVVSLRRCSLSTLTVTIPVDLALIFLSNREGMETLSNSFFFYRAANQRRARVHLSRDVSLAEVDGISFSRNDNMTLTNSEYRLDRFLTRRYISPIRANGRR